MQDKRRQAGSALSGHRREWLEQCRHTGPEQQEVEQLVQQFASTCAQLLDSL
jgi:hypothetical protein